MTKPMPPEQIATLRRVAEGEAILVTVTKEELRALLDAAERVPALERIAGETDSLKARIAELNLALDEAEVRTKRVGELEAALTAWARVRESGAPPSCHDDADQSLMALAAARAKEQT